jgi:predicted alpha-1,2-mannosidase
VDDELPATSTLQNVVDQSKDRWNKDVLSKVTTTESNSTILTQLYTALYGMHLLPSNRTGENPNPNWNKAEPYYDDIYTFWDLFRCTTPLFQVLQPVAYEELIRSIVEVYRTDGYLPDARSSNFNGRTQGGSNADNVLADAYVKGVRGKVDWETAYAAMVKDAEVVPPNNNDPSAKDSSTKEGRGALPDWLKLGYITTRFTRSVSRAVEYSVNDFSLYQVAKGLGKPTSEVNKYLGRSRNWRNHWDSTVSSFNTTGFLVPRKPDGTFIHQDPMKCDGCYWGDAYYEGRPWEYTVNAHHDVAALINLGQGPQNFLRRLSTLMDPLRKIYDPGNEPSFATPYLFNFINRQAESVKRARFVAKTQYDPGAGGLPGNSDAGAMQSWLLWNMIGLYPLTGQTAFLISSPWFADLKIDLGSGKSLEISSTNGGNSEAIYVQSLKVNGKSWNQNWLTWDDVFANGGKLEFVLGTEMTHWDTGAPPPSPASVADDGTGKAAQGSGYVGLKKHHANRKLRTIGIWLGMSCLIVLLGCMIAAFWLWRRGVWGGRYRERPADAEMPEGSGRASEELPPVDVLPDFTTEEIMKAKTVVTVQERSISESETDDDKSTMTKPPPVYSETEIGSSLSIGGQNQTEDEVHTAMPVHDNNEIHEGQPKGTEGKIGTPKGS